MKAAGLGIAVSLLLLLFFSPPWIAFLAWWRLPTVFGDVIPVRRGATVVQQVMDPFSAIVDPLHEIVRWRLLFPLVGHFLGLPPAVVLSLSPLGCAFVLAFVIGSAHRRGAGWYECSLLGIVIGAGSWFFTATGWLGYFDSWLLFGLLIVAFAPQRWMVWTACLLTPWIDERFLLGFPLALLVRRLDASPATSLRDLAPWWVREGALATLLVLAYAALRLHLAGRGSSEDVSEYWNRVAFFHLPATRLVFGTWEGLRAGWPLVASAVLILLRRGDRAGAMLLGLAVACTTVAALASANDLSRSVLLIAPVVPLGWVLARTMNGWRRYRMDQLLAVSALLLPAHHVVSDFTMPIQSLPSELQLVVDPPAVFSAHSYRQQATEAAARGRWREAERLLSIAIGLDPHDASARDDRGVLFSGEGRWPEAIREFDAALLLEPRMAAAWLHRAEAHARVGERAHALRDAATSEALAARGSPLAERAAGLAAVLRSPLTDESR